MPRAIWTGTLSFGLLNVPVSLMPGERRSELKFRMLDARDQGPVRYQRVNAETGEEVPWEEIVKAYEYEKGKYVVIEKDDIESVSPERNESIDVEAFVDAEEIGVRFFDKPYILAPGKKAEKGYVLLRETLKSTGKIGVARVVLRTREYLCAVIPEGDALVMMLLRFPEELVGFEEYALPSEEPERHRISEKEREMARALIESMSVEWNPDDFEDQFREKLLELIEERVSQEGAAVTLDEAPRRPERAATNVVDFMALLEKSLESKRPKEKSTKKPPAKKPAAKRKGPAKTRPKKTSKRAASREAG